MVAFKGDLIIYKEQEIFYNNFWSIYNTQKIDGIRANFPPIQNNQISLKSKLEILAQIFPLALETYIFSMSFNLIVIVLALQISSASILSTHVPCHHKFFVSNCWDHPYPEDERQPIPKWLYATYRNHPALSLANINNLTMISRSIDGKGNNLDNPEWGAKDIALIRRAKTNYADGVSEPVGYLPNPRVISNLIGALNGKGPKSSKNLTLGFVTWGQFISHEMDLTPPGKEEYLPIPIPDDDEFFKDAKEIDFFRSIFIKGSKPRQQPNKLSSWIDGGVVYGSDPELAKKLRAFKDGKMRTSDEGLLPKEDNKFLAGEKRANENLILTCFHSIFVWEHNRLCDEIKKVNPELSDEQIYQGARNMVVGLLQKITFDEYLPLYIGRKNYAKFIGEYRGYDPSVNPDLDNEFTTAAFRIGHSTLLSEFESINKKGEVSKKYTLKDLFANPDELSKEVKKDVFRGIGKTFMKERNEQMVDDLRNFLIRDFRFDLRLDLYSLNIQRSRDHGLSGYNEVRRAYGLNPIHNFQEIVPEENKELASKLQYLYGSPDYMDLWVGLLCERNYGDGILGELGTKITVDGFRKIRDGDRLWYEHAYPIQIVLDIKRTTFADIITRNLNESILTDEVFVNRE